MKTGFIIPFTALAALGLFFWQNSKSERWAEQAAIQINNLSEHRAILHANIVEFGIEHRIMLPTILGLEYEIRGAAAHLENKPLFASEIKLQHEITEAQEELEGVQSLRRARTGEIGK